MQLELLTGPLTGIYDPHGMGSMLFAVLAVAAQLHRDYIREKTLAGDYGPCTETVRRGQQRPRVQLTIAGPSTDPQIRGRALATVRLSRFDADRFLTELLRSAAVFDTEPR